MKYANSPSYPALETPCNPSIAALRSLLFTKWVPTPGIQPNPAWWPFGLPYWPLTAALGPVRAWNAFTLLCLFAAGALTSLANVPVGGSLKVGDVVVGRPSSGRVVGHSAICTHEGCRVAAGGRTLQCPCHGSAFDAFTGAVQHGPATSPLPGVSLVIKGTYVHRA